MIPARMRAYVLHQGHVRFADAPVPKVGPFDALVKIEQTSVCGTDVQIIQQDNWAKSNVPDGTIPGHEAAGKIIALGEKVQGFQIGEFVALESHYACDACLEAGSALDDCIHQGIVGVYGIKGADGTRQMPRSGAFAEYVSMPVSSLHHVPKELIENFQASLLEPAGNSWKIAQHFRMTGLPKSVVVFGCGPHGIFAQLFLKHIGVNTLLAVDPNAQRRAFASSFTADAVADPTQLNAELLMEQGLPPAVDATLDITGVPGVVEQAVLLTRHQGTVVMFGLPKSPEQNVNGIPYDKIIFESREFDLEQKGKQVHIIGFNGRSVAGWETLIQELTQSAALRAKLMWPLEKIGTLEELQGIITEIEQGKFTRDHKIGMSGFKP
ncbi:MAG TPA: alcohol dehydrogenase catalytic domain-containing protein [Candidatus Nanoarchaeia archaeon]|nr:alcohol dehydrogenase catalytic domain-containing protein [Candidatus Nanoarchaeia archaeon]